MSKVNNMYKNTTTTTDSTNPKDVHIVQLPYIQQSSTPQCPYLLPCGTCRLMFMICPKYNESKWEITCTNNIENK